MTKVRNALVAGAMTASALLAPMTTPAPSAVADTAASNASPTLGSAQKPCREHRHPERCRARRGHHGIIGGGDGGVGIGGGISDNRAPGNRGGAGIDN
ncbi:hypothetical protein ACFQVD_00175 [Streptosporangium amethystogenes subsp. fukuiense]|uniref:Uncharacterized protein n=1 Tax=Streptosporangium amethystogenes subsp. fukuiense TaxID=698418 RepID=A0ABW2SRA3_9ACTN